MRESAAVHVDCNALANCIGKHLRKFNKDIEKSSCFYWEAGPVSKHLPDLRVIESTGRTKESTCIYLTAGASGAYHDEDVSFEFFLIAPTINYLHIELLSMVAFMHSNPSHRLDVGHTMNIGRSFVENSSMDRLLVSLPYIYGPDFEFAHLGPNRHARILWLIPITEKEESFCHSHGLDALEQEFEEEGINYLDPYRKSVV